MRKKFFLFSAIIWSGLIIYLCLKNSNELKQIEISNFDKLIHFVFHFVFTVLWFLYLKKKFFNSNKFSLLKYSILFSIIFGIAIELMQQYFTTTRTADVFDILANLLGALIAAFLIVLINAYNGLIDKI